MSTLAEELRKALTYTPETGVFVWNIAPNGRIKIGDVAGNARTDGYTQIRFKRRLYLTHQLVWAYVHGHLPQGGLDHKDRDRANNRIGNLRPATQLENMQNKSMYCNNPSGHTGVYRNTRGTKWVANIRASGKTIHLGSFAKIEDAVQARSLAKEQHHPFVSGQSHV